MPSVESYSGKTHRPRTIKESEKTLAEAAAVSMSMYEHSNYIRVSPLGPT